MTAWAPLRHGAYRALWLASLTTLTGSWIADSTSAWLMESAGLLESLLNALARSPKSIDDAARLVERLGSTEEGKAVLPEGWDSLWSAVLEARTRLEAKP